MQVFTGYVIYYNVAKKNNFAFVLSRFLRWSILNSATELVIATPLKFVFGAPHTENESSGIQMGEYLKRKSDKTLK